MSHTDHTDSSHFASESAADVDLGANSGRTYHSPFRQSKADATRQRILDAAARLMAERGYVKMTIAGIARAAGVSAPTVYATFRSKRGILAELLDRNLDNPDLYAVHQSLHALTDPREKLRAGARLVRMVLESELPHGFEHMGGAGVIDPELLRLIMDRESLRRECQKEYIDELRQSGYLRADISCERALDTLWVLTSRPVYFMLTKERGWDGQAYEEWLYATLEAALLGCPG